jgi:hypothetical protein
MAFDYQLCRYNSGKTATKAQGEKRKLFDINYIA